MKILYRVIHVIPKPETIVNEGFVKKPPINKRMPKIEIHKAIRKVMLVSTKADKILP